VPALGGGVRLADARAAERGGYRDFVENRFAEDSGTRRGRAVFPNRDLVLQPGLFGRISIPGSTLYQGVLIPDSAVGSDQNRKIVYVIDENNAVSPRVIRPGPRIDGYRVVRRGLTGDETIVISGLIRVRPGITVDPNVVELPETAQQ